MCARVAPASYGYGGRATRAQLEQTRGQIYDSWAQVARSSAVLRGGRPQRARGSHCLWLRSERIIHTREARRLCLPDRRAARLTAPAAAALHAIASPSLHVAPHRVHRLYILHVDILRNNDPRFEICMQQATQMQIKCLDNSSIDCA